MIESVLETRDLFCLGTHTLSIKMPAMWCSGLFFVSETVFLSSLIFETRFLPGCPGAQIHLLFPSARVKPKTALNSSSSCLYFQNTRHSQPHSLYLFFLFLLFLMVGKQGLLKRNQLSSIEMISVQHQSIWSGGNWAQPSLGGGLAWFCLLVSDLLSWALSSITSTVLSSLFLADSVVKENLMVVVYCARLLLWGHLRVFGSL